MKTIPSVLQTLLVDKGFVVTPFHKGQCNELWQVLPEEGSACLVKIPRDDAEEQEANDLHTEARLLQFLNTALPHLPLPQVLWVGAQVPLYAYTPLPGQRLSAVWPFLNESARQQLFFELGKCHAQWSKAIDYEQAMALGLADHRLESIAPDESETLRELLESGDLTQAHREAWKAALDLVQSTEHLALHTFCHNDAHHDNILVDQGRLSGILDFGDADYGDVHREFVRYVTDYPGHASYVLQGFEQEYSTQLCWSRIQALAVLQGIG